MLPRHREAQRDGRKRLRAQPLIHLVPNMFTVLALCAGLTSIRYALDGRFELAVALIVAAGVLDGLDGRSARLLKISSKLGAQLDSLADFLSFGVAPAMLVYLWSLNQVKALGWALALLFATCCALRLARFNTELDDTDQPVWMSRFFTGMPAPAAAGCAIIPMLMAFAFETELAARLGAERRGPARGRVPDGQPHSHLLDQDRGGAGQAGLDPADADRRRSARRRPVQRALAHPARGRRHLPCEPAGRLVERLSPAPSRRGRGGRRPSQKARRRASSASAASAANADRAPRRTEARIAEARACSMRACVG